MVVILSPDALAAVRMTVDEYLAAELPEGQRYELVAGEVEMSPVPGIPHERVVARLHRLLGRYQDRFPDRIDLIATKAAIALPAQGTVREPDLAVYSSGASAQANWKIITPALVIEVVSLGQDVRDYQEKRRDYWEAGIAEYWIADPLRGTLTVLTRDGWQWAETVHDREATARCAALPDFEVSVESVLG